VKRVLDLGALEWRLSGWTPHLWRLMQTLELSETPNAEVMGVPARVPGSVQLALREAGRLPDWNHGENWRSCEWVEHRHWIYEAELPGSYFRPAMKYRLHCEGLDYSGWVFLNGKEVGAFRGAHTPHVFDLTPAVRQGDNTLRIVFDLPPRWLGQFGFTSEVRDWKARFNYTWDWQPRLVQTGIWEPIRLVESDGREIRSFRCWGDADPERGTGALHVRGRVPSSTRVRLRLDYAGFNIRTEEVPAARFNARGAEWSGLAIDLWWPNLAGQRHLYTLTCELLDAGGSVLDKESRRVGFRRIEWRACEGAPEGADPWLCVVNGRPVFLQGVNVPPMLPNFADTPAERYRKILRTYADLGMNALRVNGVGFLEKELFYDLCDELGLLVWQDIPLSGSGVDMVPPTDPQMIREAEAVTRSFIERRQHHPSLFLWCGGNELHRRDEKGVGIPLDLSHPMLRAMDRVVRRLDPGRRFLPTTATGPRFNADRADFGKGLHWNTHGPWKLSGTMQEWRDYWNGDDSLFRAESGAPGAAPAAVIRQFAGGLDPMPVSPANPAWRRPLTWWIEDAAFAQERGRAPESLEEYVAWSQARQAEALSIAVSASKARFPRCGGILLWCGHDCFPCPANTSILDFHGDPKPAAAALSAIWRGSIDD
jgi:beta-mannosidase